MLAKSEVEAILDRSSNQRLATIEEKAQLFQKLQQLCPTSKEIEAILHYWTEVEIFVNDAHPNQYSLQYKFNQNGYCIADSYFFIL